MGCLSSYIATSPKENQSLISSKMKDRNEYTVQKYRGYMLDSILLWCFCRDVKWSHLRVRWQLLFVPFLALLPVRLPNSITLCMNMQNEPLHGYGHTVSTNTCPSLLFICTGIVEQETWKKKKKPLVKSKVSPKLLTKPWDIGSVWRNLLCSACFLAWWS